MGHLSDIQLHMMCSGYVWDIFPQIHLFKCAMDDQIKQARWKLTSFFYGETFAYSVA